MAESTCECGQNFSEYISELITRLDAVVERKLRGISLGSFCVNCEATAKFGISLYSITARHCGKRECQMRALVIVASHANEHDVSKAIRPIEDDSLHGLVRDLESLLNKINHVDDIANPVDFRCTGLDKEAKCERIAKFKISLDNVEKPYCGNCSCRRFTLLMLVAEVLSAAAKKAA